MYTEIHGADAGSRPVRSATLLGNRYFIDRFVGAIGAILTAFLPVLWMGRSANVQRLVDAVTACYPAGAAALKQDLPRRNVQRLMPYEFGAPGHEQYLSLATNYLLWEPLAGTLLLCALLAIALEWRSAQR